MSNIDGDLADRVVLSYRAPEVGVDDGEREWVLQDSGWIQDNISTDSYAQYVRRSHGGPVEVGEEWDEFVNCGCASPTDVVLRVETVDGGWAIGEDTEIEFVPLRDVIQDSAPA